MPRKAALGAVRPNPRLALNRGVAEPDGPDNVVGAGFEDAGNQRQCKQSIVGMLCNRDGSIPFTEPDAENARMQRGTVTAGLNLTREHGMALTVRRLDWH